MNPKEGDNINPETGKEYFSNLNPEKFTKHLPKEESIEGSDIEKQLQLKDKRIKELEGEVDIVCEQIEGALQDYNYWKSRCEAAEHYIFSLDYGVSYNRDHQLKEKWQELKNKQP